MQKIKVRCVSDIETMVVALQKYSRFELHVQERRVSGVCFASVCMCVLLATSTAFAARKSEPARISCVYLLTVGFRCHSDPSPSDERTHF